MISALFKETLRNVLDDSNSLLFDYSSERDFSELWAADNNRMPAVLHAFTRTKNVVIIWEGFQRSRTDQADTQLEPHLTPLDWALSFSNAVIDRSKERPDCHVHIVDLTSKKFEDAWAIRMRHQLVAEMPWVSLYAPLLARDSQGNLPTYREGYRLILQDPNLASGGLLTRQNGTWVLANDRKGLSAYSLKGRGKGLGDLRKQWTASLTQSDDHHDINNLVGANLLAKAKHRHRGLKSAFVKRLDWGGFDLNRASSWKSWDVDLKDNLFGRALHVYVVDDQLQHGWTRFLCRLLNAECDENVELTKNAFVRIDTQDRQHSKGEVKIHGCQGPEPLIKFLGERAIFNKRDYSRQITSGSLSPELIFLDLRLYADSQIARGAAIRLIRILRSDKLRGGLAWRKIDDEEVERIDRWAAGSLNDRRAADEALLLLPRMLSLALPLTPLILFSSTGQTWIKERLKPYRNVISDFEKPRVLSDWASIDASIAALRYGLDSAVSMMRLRLQLAHAQQAVKIAERDRPKATGLADQHVEIFADETRELEDGITSGLAVTIFPNLKTAEQLQARLLDEFRKQSGGASWLMGDSRRRPTLEKGAQIAKEPGACETQSLVLAKLLEECGLGPNQRMSWSIVATRVSPAIPKSRGPVVSINAFPDGPLDEALRFNLDFILHVLLPYLAKGDDAPFKGSIYVYLPTRVVPYQDSQFARELCAAFDLGLPEQYEGGGPWFVRSSSLVDGVGSAFPLVRGWLQEWQDTSPDGMTSRIGRIKMTNLGQGERSPITPEKAGRRRLLHNIADWACTASGKLHDIETDKWVWPLKLQLTEKQIFNRWYVSTDATKTDKTRRTFETDKENAFALMMALKMSFRDPLGDGSETDPLRLILRNSYVAKCVERLWQSEYCSQQRLLLWKLRRQLENATGESLHALLT